MPKTFTRRLKYSRSQWAVILFCLKICSLLVLLPLLWLFKKMSGTWGNDAAQIIFTFLSAGILIVVFMGLGLGLVIDYTIRHRRYIFRDPQPNTLIYRTIRMWGYEVQALPHQEIPAATLGTEKLTEERVQSYQLPEKASRPGRKPQFSVKDWVPVALVWEQRDPAFDLFSLEDVISQKLGKAADGAPIISAKAYRGTWRKRVIRYINEHGLAKKTLPEEDETGRQMAKG